MSEEQEEKKESETADVPSEEVKDNTETEAEEEKDTA